MRHHMAYQFSFSLISQEIFCVKQSFKWRYSILACHVSRWRRFWETTCRTEKAVCRVGCFNVKMIRKICVTPAFVNIKCTLRCFSQAPKEKESRNNFFLILLWVVTTWVCEFEYEIYVKLLKWKASIVEICSWKWKQWGEDDMKRLQGTININFKSDENVFFSSNLVSHSQMLYRISFLFKANKVFSFFSSFHSTSAPYLFTAINRAFHCQTLFFYVIIHKKKKKHLSLETFSATLIIKLRLWFHSLSISIWKCVEKFNMTKEIAYWSAVIFSFR